MAPALFGRGDGAEGWGAAEPRSRRLPWDGAPNPEPPASLVTPLHFIFPANSLCPPAQKEKAGRGSWQPPCPVYGCLKIRFFFFFFPPPWFCDQNSWLSLCQGFQPQDLLLLLQNRKAKGDERLGLLACVSMRPQRHFPGAGLVPARPALPSGVNSVLPVRERGGSLPMGRRNAATFNPSSGSWLGLCFPRVGGGALQPPT